MAREKRKPKIEELEEIFKTKIGITTKEKLAIVSKYKYISDIKRELNKLKESN